MGLMLDSDGEFGCGPGAVATQLAGAACESSPATAVSRKRALDVNFSSCPKRSRPASEGAATATSYERALDVQDAVRVLAPGSRASDHPPAAWPREARAEVCTPAGAATGEPEAGEAAGACQAQAGAGLSAAPRAPADPAYAEGALTLVDLPAHLIACVVDQLPADDELAVALTCRELRTASEHSSRSARGSPLVTRPSSLFSSLRKLQWGVACGAGLSPDLCDRATEGGHLDQLVWLCSIGCPRDKETCEIAGARGHLHILQWARQNGCPWNEETCALAAANGHYDCLVWARENGCPWSAMTFEQAVAGTDSPEI
jgi:hypothetical protein